MLWVSLFGHFVLLVLFCYGDFIKDVTSYFQDLIKYTPASHPDHAMLTDALNMTQHFLDEFNIIQTKSLFPVCIRYLYKLIPFFEVNNSLISFGLQNADRAQRRLVKNSFIVELSDGHRKLRHLFLFNDVIACAKYKVILFL